MWLLTTDLVMATPDSRVEWMSPNKEGNSEDNSKMSVCVSVCLLFACVISFSPLESDLEL